MKRLRPSTDEPAVTVKVETAPTVTEAPPTVQVKEEVVEAAPVPTPVSRARDDSRPCACRRAEGSSHSSGRRTDADGNEPLPPPSSIITTGQSPPSTSPETETAIKAVYSSIQIPTPNISKLSTLDKATPIIAPISKETLPIVEHQTTPITTTTSILPTHVSIKSTLPSTAFSKSFFLSSAGSIDFSLSR